MFGLERMSEAGGRPNEGVHRHVLGVAVFDLGLTVAACAVTAAILGFRWFPLILLVALLLGVVAHRVFNVRTTFDRILFP